jgi:hypothetical protein
MGEEMNLLVRTRVPPLSVLHAVRTQIQSVDPDQEVDQYVPSLEELIGVQTEWQRGRLMAMLFSAFGILALALATAGLYSVVSYGTARENQRIWHPHGAGRRAQACALDRSLVNIGRGWRWHAGGSYAVRGPEFAPGEMDRYGLP